MAGRKIEVYLAPTTNKLDAFYYLKIDGSGFVLCRAGQPMDPVTFPRTKVGLAAARQEACELNVQRV